MNSEVPSREILELPSPSICLDSITLQEYCLNGYDIHGIWI